MVVWCTNNRRHCPSAPPSQISPFFRGRKLLTTSCGLIRYGLFTDFVKNNLHNSHNITQFSIWDSHCPSPKQEVGKRNSSLFLPPFLTRELRACARAICRYDVENGTRSIPVNLFSILGFWVHLFDFRLLSAFDSFWRVVNKRNGDLCC